MLSPNKTQYLKNFSLINSIYSLNTLGTNILELFLVLVEHQDQEKVQLQTCLEPWAPSTNKKMVFVSSSAMHMTQLVGLSESYAHDKYICDLSIGGIGVQYSEHVWS